MSNPQWPDEGSHHHEHDQAARSAVDDAHDAADDDRAAALDAVDEARIAVTRTAESLGGLSAMLSGLSAMLQRHYRLGLTAVTIGVVVGVGLLMLFFNLRISQEEQRAIQEAVDIQTRLNEIAETRGQVNERKSLHRLCVVALGASRTPEVAEQICLPVLGDDYDDLQARVETLEKRLERRRNGG